MINAPILRTMVSVRWLGRKSAPMTTLLTHIWNLKKRSGRMASNPPSAVNISPTIILPVSILFESSYRNHSKVQQEKTTAPIDILCSNFCIKWEPRIGAQKLFRPGLLPRPRGNLSSLGVRNDVRSIVNSSFLSPLPPVPKLSHRPYGAEGEKKCGKDHRRK